MNRSDEYARVLLQKARDDQYVLVRLAADAAAPPWTLGFHAQQAVEKALKAVLSARGVVYPMTHDIQRLLDLSKGAGLAMPPQASQMPLLSPFGAALRYDEVPEIPGGKPFDRQWAMRLVDDALGWADKMLV